MIAGIELDDRLELELELEILLELELWLELDNELDELLLELLMLLELLLLLLLLDDDTELSEINELLELDGEEDSELELLDSEDEDTKDDDELEGPSSVALLLDTRLLEATDELLDEDLTELAKEEDLVVPVPGVVLVLPPPQAVKAADRDTAETIRKE